jgi:DNA-binding CsgD family transcriptional regulator
MSNEQMSVTQRFGAAFTGLWRKREGMTLRSIRPAMIVYMLAYPAELILYHIGQSYMAVETKLLGVAAFTPMYIGHIIFSLVIMLLWSDRFKHLVHISVAVFALGFLPWLFLPEGTPRLVCAIVAWTGLGGCVTSARCGFAFVSNNAERMAGLMMMFATTCVFAFLQAFAISGVALTYIIPILVAATLVFCLLKFKEADFDVKDEATPSDSKGLYWAFVYFTAYFAINGYACELYTEGSQDALVLLAIGKTACILIFFAIMVWWKRSVWHIWNIFFVFCVILGVLVVLEPQFVASVFVPKNLLVGLCELGWPAALYMLACAQRRFASYRLLKQCTVVFVLLAPVTTLSDDFANALFPGAIPQITLVYILVVVIGILILSPFSYKYLFSVNWLSDLTKDDMEPWHEKVEQADRFEGYGLTPREKQVLALLLSGSTLRQITGRLGIAQGTVNTHADRIYKKIGVNSKAELFVKFGATETN